MQQSINMANGLDSQLGNPFIGTSANASIYSGVNVPPGLNGIFGSSGDDTLYGSYSDDFLYGGEGNDILLGGNGNDVLVGYHASPTQLSRSSYSQVDTLTGGGGADTFQLGNKPDNIPYTVFDYYDSSFTIPGTLKNQGRGFFGEGYSSYAIIADFKSSQGDKLKLGMAPSEFTVDKSYNLLGSSALDTGLYYKGDLIAVLQDTTNFSIGTNTVI